MSKPTPPTKLIVVMAFEDDGEGNMRPAFDPREYQSEQRARIEAGSLINTYPAVTLGRARRGPILANMALPMCCSVLGRCRIWNDRFGVEERTRWRGMGVRGEVGA